MFGLFRKKKSNGPGVGAGSEAQAAASPRSAASATKVAEWDATIARIKEGFHSAIAEATRASEAIVASATCDLSALDRIWTPVGNQLERDQKALHRAWSSTDTILSRDEAFPAEHRAFEETKYHEENNELEIAQEGAYREAKARAARALLDAGQDQHAATNVARYLGEWDAFGHWQNMKRAEMRIDRYEKTKDVPMELLHELNGAAQQYWQMALGIEAQLVPHLVAHLPNTIDARMKETRKFLRNHWQWRAFEESQ